MFRGLFGPSSLSHALRESLDESMRTHDSIAKRVADAAMSSASGDFAKALDAAKAGRKPDEADLQRDMAELADTQIRYEAESRMLRGVYSGIRTAVRERI